MTSDESDIIDVHAIEAGGIRMRARIQGAAEPRGLPVVVLHGFTGSVESMAGTASALAAERTVISLDLVGHGLTQSPDDLIHYVMHRCVAQLRDALDRLGIGRAHMLGYSMGGRAALSFCADHPDRVASALLVGASAGLSDPETRRQRMQDDERLAKGIVEGGLEKFVEEWMAKPLFASQSRLGEKALTDAREQRLRNDPHGLARSLRGMGTGAMEPIDPRRVPVPLCFVTGAEDEKFSRIARELAEAFSSARHVIIERAGHAAHLENPFAFRDVALRYFDSVEQTQAGARS